MEGDFIHNPTYEFSFFQRIIVLMYYLSFSLENLNRG